jgi:hypothetical protein
MATYFGSGLGSTGSPTMGNTWCLDHAKATKRRERLTGSYAAEFDKACEWSVLARKGTSSVTSQIEAPHGPIGQAPDTA